MFQHSKCKCDNDDSNSSMCVNYLFKNKWEDRRKEQLLFLVISTVSPQFSFLPIFIYIFLNYFLRSNCLATSCSDLKNILFDLVLNFKVDYKPGLAWLKGRVCTSTYYRLRLDELRLPNSESPWTSKVYLTLQGYQGHIPPKRRLILPELFTTSFLFDSFCPIFCSQMMCKVMSILSHSLISHWTLYVKSFK